MVVVGRQEVDGRRRVTYTVNGRVWSCLSQSTASRAALGVTRTYRAPRSGVVSAFTLAVRSQVALTNMSITHVTSLSQLNGILSSGSNEKLTVIDFHATWCAPDRAVGTSQFPDASRTGVGHAT